MTSSTPPSLAAQESSSIDQESKHYERAIVAACRAPSAMEGLHGLAAALRIDAAVLTTNLSRPTSRNHQLLLAGLLLRAGFTRSAWCVVGGDPSQGPVAADAIVIDPGFVHLEGHHANSNAFYQRLLTGAGLHHVVLRNKRHHPSFLKDTSGSRPCFSLSPYESIYEGQPSGADLSNHNDLFGLDFRHVLPQIAPAALVVHSVRHTFVDGMAQYLEQASAPDDCSLLLGVIEAEVADLAHPLHRAAALIYRKAFKRLRTVRARVLIIVETESVAEFLRNNGAADWPIVVAPYAAGQMLDLPRRPARIPTVPIVGYVGQTRPERGALLLPEVIRSSLDAHSQFRWRVQLDITRVRQHLGKDLDNTLASIEHSGRFELVETNQSVDDYYKLLGSLDLVVLPYASRYKHTGSGVAIECLRAGCVLIVPADSTMARDAERIGAGFVSFSELTTLKVTQAIVHAVERFAELRTLSARAADNYRVMGLEPLSRFVQGQDVSL